MKIILTISCCLCVSLMGADKDRPLSPREVMKLFVGSWDSEMTIIAEGDSAKSQTSKMTRVRKWSPGKNFVVEQVTPDGLVWVLTYDPNKKNYRSVVITPEVTSNIYGSWDDSRKIMTWHGHDDDGNLSKGHHRVIDKDHHEWEMSILSADKLIVKLTGKHKRRIKTKK
jgi:hypothetical protein